MLIKNGVYRGMYMIQQLNGQDEQLTEDERVDATDDEQLPVPVREPVDALVDTNTVRDDGNFENNELEEK